jgi:hypothetical protein
MGLNTSAVGQGQGSTEFYGHADYYRDKAAGMSDYDIKKLIDADTSKMGNGGTGGELYAQISAGARPPSNNNNNNSGGGGGYSPSQPGGTVGREGFRKAYGEEFQSNYNEAMEGYRPDDSKKGNFAGTSSDFQRGMTQEQAIIDNDPFGDSNNSIDFMGKFITAGREAQKGRGDGTAIANKYIFNAQQTNPINVQALDQQIRTNPLYSEAKATLAKKNVFGDQYAATSPIWDNPDGPSPYEAPDLQGISKKYSKKIDDMSL